MKLLQSECRDLTWWNDVIPLEDAGRGQVVYDVLQADVSEDGAKRRALLRAQKRLLLSQLCSRTNRVSEKRTGLETDLRLKDL